MSRGLTHRRLLGLAVVVSGLLHAPFPQPAASGDLPPPPQWVGAAETRGVVRLTWVRTPVFAKVRVYRKDPGAAAFSLRGEALDNVFTDAEVSPGAAYVYRLHGLAADGREGPASMELTVRVAAVRLLPPEPPVWEGFLPVEGGVGLRWSAQAGRDVIAYNVYRRTPPDPEFVLVGSTRSPSFRDSAVEPDRVYVYALTALDSSFVETPRSQELEARLAVAPPPPALQAPSGLGVRRTRAVATVTRGDGAPLLRPADVVAGPLSGDFYLADSGRRQVFVYSRTGEFRRALRGAGEPGEGLGNVLGVAVDADETLYAVDAGIGLVRTFPRSGRAGGSIDVGSLRPEGPFAIVDAGVDRDGTLHVVDNRGSRVLAIGPGGGLRSVGGPGSGPGDLSAPTFCAFGPEGDLYVSDALRARVTVYGPAGEFRRSFGRYRRGPGGFGRPKGIAVAPSGEIFVADSWLNVVQVFDREGAFVALLGDEEGRPLDLGSPNGVALAPGGRIVAIAERLSSRLQIRELLDDR